MPRIRFAVTTGPRGRLISLGLIAATLLGACGATSAAKTMSRTTTSTSSTTTTTEYQSRVMSVTTTTLVTAESLSAGSSLVGEAMANVEIYEWPAVAAPSQTLEAATPLGSPRVFLVERGPIDGWVEVALPIRPNGSTGWVRTDDLELDVVDQAIVVDLTGRWLRLEQGDEILLETEVAIGSPHNPTPVGNYFVTDVVELADPTGPWGPFALGLSAFSDTITEFNGGDGVIGIHGTNRPASIGEPVSLGCVRVPNEVAIRLADLVKLGTPVEIRA